MANKISALAFNKSEKLKAAAKVHLTYI